MPAPAPWANTKQAREACGNISRAVTEVDLPTSTRSFCGASFIARTRGFGRGSCAHERRLVTVPACLPLQKVLRLHQRRCLGIVAASIESLQVPRVGSVRAVDDPLRHQSTPNSALSICLIPLRLSRCAPKPPRARPRANFGRTSSKIMVSARGTALSQSSEAGVSSSLL